MLKIAILFVTLAMIFYSSSIIINLASKKIKSFVLILIWLGVFCDISGIIFMFQIRPGVHFDVHSIIGISALFLMSVKAMILVYRYFKCNKIDTVIYKVFGTISWLLWMYGFYSGMQK